jgi:hypothetical protein
VIAPIPFRNELLGAGLVLGAGYLYGARESDRSARHSIAAAAGMLLRRWLAGPALAHIAVTGPSSAPNHCSHRDWRA